MARPFTAAERVLMEPEVWKRSLRGESCEKIAQEFKTTRRSIQRMLKRLRAQMAEGSEDRMVQALTVFTGEQRLVMDDAWERLKREPSAYGVVGLQANILKASENIAKANGLFATRVDVTSGGESIGDFIRQMLSEPVEVIDVTPQELSEIIPEAIEPKQLTDKEDAA